MKKRYAIFLFLWITIVPCLNAQKKEIQQAEAIVKSGKNLDRAEQQMRRMLTDSVNRRNLKIWTTMTNAVRGQYLQGNERLYLHLKQDTAALFKLAHKMFRDYQAMDSVDALPDKKGRIRIKYRSSHAAFLQAIAPIFTTEASSSSAGTAIRKPSPCSTPFWIASVSPFSRTSISSRIP